MEKPTMLNEKFDPAELRALRHQLGWSAERMGREVGFSFASILNWEKGRTRPIPSAVEKLQRIKNQARRLAKER
jgi:DNA-binding transcriptional regulator YiaG